MAMFWLYGQAIANFQNYVHTSSCVNVILHTCIAGLLLTSIHTEP